MLLHILLMNVAAPAAAFLCRPRMPAAMSSLGRCIGFAAGLQVAALWAWHLPQAMTFGVGSTAGSTVMHLMLLAVAVWFWTCVIAAAGPQRWRALGALLISGKLVCFLGVLLVFSPRPLYSLHEGGHLAADLEPIADQQLAGILMLISCPLVYVFASIVLAVRWLAEIDRRVWRPS
jgi:putative membrane protein